MTCLLHGASTQQSATCELPLWRPLTLLFTDQETSLWIKVWHFIHYSSWMGCCHSNAGIFLIRMWAISAQSREETHISHINVLSSTVRPSLQRSPIRLSGVSAIPPSFMSSANLVRVHSALSSRPLMKMLNSSLHRVKKSCRFSNYDLIFMMGWWVLNKGTGFKLVSS